MNKIFKKRAHITALTVGLLCPVGCSGDIQGSNLELYNVNVAQSSESSFKKIDWILSKNGTQIIRGINPNPNPSYNSLENLVFTDIDPNSFDITPWDITVMAKFVPLKRLIEKHADHYSIDPMWASQFFNLESLMIPTDHNTLSDDFGLGQIKRNSERLAKRLGTDPTNVLYSPDLDTNGNIFDPETNIIMAMLLHRYNIKKHGLKNSNQVYAVYFRGKPGLKPNGAISKIAKDNVDGLRERFELYRNVIPLFGLREGEFGTYPHLLSWKDDEIELLYHRLKGMVHVAFRKDCFDMPEKTYKEIQLDVPEALARTAKLIAHTATHQLELLNKLRQISDGFLYTESGAPVFAHTPKLEALTGILDEHRENEDNRIIIYGAFKITIDQIVHCAAKAGWNIIRVDGRGWKHFISEGNKATVARSLDPEYLYKLFQMKEEFTQPIAFVAHPASAGEGLTLPSPAIVYYSNDFNGRTRMQSEERTRGSPIIYDLLCLSTDKLILDNLKKKKNLQSISLGEIRSKLNE